MALNREKIHQSAQRLVLKGQLDRAIQELRPILNEDPNDARTLQKIAELQRKKGAYQEAEAVYVKLADVLMRGGFYQRAVAVYNQILQLSPTNLPVHVSLGDTLTKLGLLQEANKIYSRTVGLLQRANRFDEATAILEKLIGTAPENYQARLQLAELYLKAGRTDAAVRAFEEALPTLRSQGRDDLFQRAAERLLYYQPENLPLCRELSVFHLRRGNVPQAMKLLQYCHKRDPQDVDTLRLLASHFEAAGDVEKAVVVLHQMARVFEGRGEDAEAIDVHRRILQVRPGDRESAKALGAGVPLDGPAPAAERPAPPPRRLPPPPGARTPALPASPDAAEEEAEITSEPVESSDIQEISSAVVHESDFPETDLPRVEETLNPVPPSTIEAALEEEVSAERRVPAPTATRGGGAVRVRPGDAGDLPPLPDEPAEVQKIGAEADIFVKFGLKDRALGHLAGGLAQFSQSCVLRDRMIAIHLNDENLASAVRVMLEAARGLAAAHRDHARRYLREALFLDEENGPAREMLEALDGGAALPAAGASPAVAADERRSEPGAAPTVEDHAPELDVDIDVSSEPMRTVVVPPLGAAAASFAPVRMDDRVPAPSAARPAPAAAPPRAAPRAAVPVARAVPAVPEPPAARLPAAAFPPVPVAIPPRPAGGASGAVVEPLPKALVFDLPSFDEVDEAPPFLRSSLPPLGEKLVVPLSEAAAAPLVLEMEDEDFDGLPVGEGLEDEFSETELPSPLPAGAAEGVDGWPTGDLPVSDLPTVQRLEAAEAAAAPRPEPAESAPAPAAPAAAALDPAVTEALEEVEFFHQQGLIEDARTLLEGLAAEHPEDQRIAAKLAAIAGETSAPIPAPTALEALDSAFDALESGASGARPLPDAVEGPVAEAAPTDATMHFDLGVAYREMGVLDRAVDEFRLAAQDPAREANCHAMIGACLVALGKTKEAVEALKKGLHARRRSEQDELELYYGLADAHLATSDAREALFYLQTIKRKDPEFRDVAHRITALLHSERPGRRPTPRAEPAPDAEAEPNIDEAFDDMFKDQRH